MVRWWGDGRERLFGAGSTMGPTLTGAGGFGSRFFEPMSKNRLGMCCGPAVGQHLLQTQVIRIEAEQKVADVDPRLDAMTLGARKDCVQHGCSWARGFIAQEEPILAANGLMAKRPLADVVVDRQATIFGVAT